MNWVGSTRSSARLFKWPFFLPFIGVNTGVILACFGLGPLFYGWIGVITSLLVTQSPVIYLIMKEIRRKNRMLELTRSEAREASSEGCRAGMDEFARFRASTVDIRGYITPAGSSAILQQFKDTGELARRK